MSDTPPENPPDEPEPQPDPEPTAPDGDEVAKWKALARKHEARAKAGAAAEKRLAELEDANKSELQRAAESARSWQERAEAAELRAMRAEVAARKGLTAAQAKRLQGSTEEELEADADELLSAFQAEPPTNGTAGLPPADRRPEPRLRPGAVPDAGPTETDPAKLAAAISRRSF